ncbi:argininosuccinate synthase domain-containing protein [Saccharothrix variisporea]|uniref:argininosuccinate synthase n=1 Tax=Saccharothrix variisporea TaxID=543527 RepID=A0A495XKI4_9PSEU|nr:argininosuccinate synthase domain-containing protein [Saccharothrix variisporea]RKT73506.1 argininosuccinate synthase [Saccharothrix variisporea]
MPERVVVVGRETFETFAVALAAADVVVVDVDEVLVDAADEFADSYCLPALLANAAEASGSALADPLVAKHVVATAREHGATTVAHSGGERLGTCLHALAPDLRVIVLDHAPAASRTVWSGSAVPHGDDPQELVVTFDRGVPVALDGETVTAGQALREVNLRTGGHGAATLITAHRELEEITLERDLVRFKRRVERRWGELVHDGLWYSPLKDALDTFIEHTQGDVSGEIRLVLHGGRATTEGIRAAV